MELLPNSTFGQPAKDLKTLLESCCAIDPDTYFIDFDTIWSRPEHRKTLISIMEASLSIVVGSLPYLKVVLLSPDNLRRPYGLIPVTGYLANKLGTYMAVWKEAASVSTGLGNLYGPSDTPLDCFVFQDVIAGGSTIRKMIPTLSKSAWNIRAYICLVLARPENLRVEQNLKRLAEASSSTSGTIELHYVAQWAE